jgi:hypothetical protein
MQMISRRNISKIIRTGRGISENSHASKGEREVRE